MGVFENLVLRTSAAKDKEISMLETSYLYPPYATLACTGVSHSDKRC
jgi:hypothetical protein